MKLHNRILLMVALFVPALLSMDAPERMQPESKFKLEWGYSDRQGEKDTMNNAYVFRKMQLTPFTEPAAFFGVFAGYRGPEAANFASKIAPLYFAFAFKDLYRPGLSSAIINEASFSKAYTELDKAMLEENEFVGTTAITGLLEGTMLDLAWVGNVRGLVIGNDGKIKAQTIDHTPDLEQERTRIEGAGEVTWVLNDVTRVGNFEVSRILGGKSPKADLKPKAVISEPEVISTEVERGDTILLASEGIWRVLSNDQVVEFVQKHKQMSVEELQARFSTKKFEKPEQIKEDCSQGRREGVSTDICDQQRLVLVARGLRDFAAIEDKEGNISVMLLQVQ